jgi:D-alanyl-D-alanine dipeptidase
VSILVRVNKYSKYIRELSMIKRVSSDYPLLCLDIVAKKLAEAVILLPSGYSLQVDSAYRTKKTQEILFENRKHIPNLVHDPKAGVSPHTTGSALDISLVDGSGREINLSEPFSKYYEEPQLVSDKISPKSQKLRNILHDVMVKVGFTPNPKEYWHFSYGSYPEIGLPKSFFFPFYLRIYYKIFRRIWKLFNTKTNY